eukprot:5731531-Prymnesium_polylepis.1
MSYSMPPAGAASETRAEKRPSSGACAQAPQCGTNGAGNGGCRFSSSAAKAPAPEPRTRPTNRTQTVQAQRRLRQCLDMQERSCGAASSRKRSLMALSWVDVMEFRLDGGAKLVIGKIV